MNLLLYELVYIGDQGLLDEGDSSMDDAESECKVSESVQCLLYSLVQVGADNHDVTISEERSAASGDKVSMINVCQWF